MIPKFDAQHYLDKFEPIPEEDWCVGSFHEGDAQHCAMGFCDSRDHVAPGYMTERGYLQRLFHIHLHSYVSVVNDGGDKRYQQPTPKQRVIAALKDIQQLESAFNQ